MEGLNELFNFILPVHPRRLIAKGAFPDCQLFFEKIIGHPEEKEYLCNNFINLCRISAVAWIVWGISWVLWLLALYLAIYNWGLDEDEAILNICGGLECKKCLSMLFASLLTLKLFFLFLANVCMQLIKAGETRIMELISKK